MDRSHRLEGRSAREPVPPRELRLHHRGLLADRRRLAGLLGVSEATMSSWMNGKSTPSLAKAIDIAGLFQISTDRLMGAEFADLLANELANPERFEKVETRVKRGRSKLKSV
ncbi:MAG: helix-turn-helix domain-containing protein [Thermoleophilia bacterium]|nr:helix-turn-helix domain-containing protein [Thermoleophilia bacterium]MDH4339257.1 helix-turn-helix domain-containing protein [Thermoleophilia bacterium]MDH5281726.1 helix-turn-helix domain-containing protein [Thermoleophilia bacterium]